MMWLIHAIVFFIFWPALIVTVPAHLIINAIKDNKPKEPKAEKPYVPYKEGRISDRNKAIIGVVGIILLALIGNAIGTN